MPATQLIGRDADDAVVLLGDLDEGGCERVGERRYGRLLGLPLQLQGDIWGQLSRGFDLGHLRALLAIRALLGLAALDHGRAQVFGVDAGSVEDTAAGVRVGDTELSYGQVIEKWFGAGGEVLGHGAVRKADAFAEMPPFWEIGCSGVVLSVDRETGVVDVEKLTTIGDVGFAINPALVRGQDAGAALMGLGAALHEELVYEGEQLVNPNVVDYRVPRFSDVPGELEHILAERRDGAGPYGAKGAGEGAGNTIGGAVASAIGRAIGVFPHELPATPERVWRLIQTREKKGG